MNQTIIIDLSKITNNVRSNVFDSIVAKSNELGLSFRLDIISNRLLINCDDQSKIVLTNYIIGLGGYANNWIGNRVQRFTKRFLIYVMLTPI